MDTGRERRLPAAHQNVSRGETVLTSRCRAFSGSACGAGGSGAAGPAIAYGTTSSRSPVRTRTVIACQEVQPAHQNVTRVTLPCEAGRNAFRKFALAIRRSQQPVPSRAGLRAPENVPPSALFFGSSVGLARVRA